MNSLFIQYIIAIGEYFNWDNLNKKNEKIFSFLILNHLGTGVAMSVAIYCHTNFIPTEAIILKKDLKPTNLRPRVKLSKFNISSFEANNLYQ